MVSYMQIESLTKSVGDRLLFGDFTFGIYQGDKIGLIAKNGSGKSTLLRILAGKDSPDSGRITTRTGLRIAMLDQDSVYPPGMPVIDACLMSAPCHDPHLDADARRDKMCRLLSQLGVADITADTSTLSGGQTKRAALACAIYQDADLLLLDEPTNHLDIRVIEWLENFLRKSRTTILMVTHDRYFLDRVCNKIIEIDRGSIFEYTGNYDYYIRRRAERMEALGAELAKVKNTLRREQEWMSRQPQARAGKAKYRIDRFFELKERSRINLTERHVQIARNADTYIGSKVFEAEGISKRFGDKVILDGFTYTFARGEKIGIVGRNGVGKSTFIKMLMGIVPQDTGCWNVGETVRFGYYSQDGISLDGNKKVIDAVSEIADDIDMGDGNRISPMQLLQRFLFSVPEQQKYIATLSGGEKRRLYLATVLMRRPNFLILDEPTNDLDIVTLGLLEEYLADFKGCAIIISHDRFFLDNIVDHIFVMEGNGLVKDFPGTYTEYATWRDSQQQDKPAPASEKPRQKPAQTRPRKMSFKERREFETIEAELEKLNAEKAELDNIFNSGRIIEDVAALSARYNEIKDIIDEKEMRWLELSELL